MRILGIDLGSREVKISLLEQDKIIENKKISTMCFYKDYCSYDGKIIVDLNKFNIGKVDRAVSTGYGRNNTNLNTFTAINEIKAHVYGAFYQTELKDFILLDIGGQDVKVVRVEKGIITDLELNEKCAASCGRYLENMASVLEISVNEMSKYCKNPVELNSTCAVFSESELIGKIAEGVGIDRLCSGVNYSLYKRLQPLLSRFKGEKLVLTGGVANNQSIRYYLKKDYKEIVYIEKPEFNGSIGCCCYGSKFLK